MILAITKDQRKVTIEVVLLAVMPFLLGFGYKDSCLIMICMLGLL